MAKIIDISHLISEKTAVFPGDTTFQRSLILDQDKGDHITLSTIKTTLHIGSHADAHSHANTSAKTIEHMDLDHYIGKCVVVEASLNKNNYIQPNDIKNLKEILPNIPERILIKTNSCLDSTIFNHDFPCLHATLINLLADNGVFTIGIDTPSVDFANSKNLESHHLCFLRNIAIIEGLNLKNADCGYYELIALPLPLKGCDGSPVRAILRTVS
tara:strand:- start:608 stop:1249 length:642 start_codon:yes stop_codon:yes gene_type:complete